MPLEIGEISVRMAVEEQHGQPGQQPVGDAAVLPAAQQDHIINECVRQVLLALQRQQAR